MSIELIALSGSLTALALSIVGTLRFYRKATHYLNENVRLQEELLERAVKYTELQREHLDLHGKYSSLQQDYIEFLQSNNEQIKQVTDKIRAIRQASEN